MVDGIDVVRFVKTVLNENVTEHSSLEVLEPLTGSSDCNGGKKSIQSLDSMACNIMCFTNKDDHDRQNEKHIQNDSNNSHSCTICTASFRRHDHLKRHINSVHTNSNYYICPVCNEDCKRHDVLSKHMKSTHSDKPCIFHCRECTFECGSLSDYEKHERVHLLTERHACPHCSSSFKRRDHMLRHVKSQHLLQYSICPLCDQTFKRKDHVARHIREKHNRRCSNSIQIP